jgi:hypothetical protein
MSKPPFVSHGFSLADAESELADFKHLLKANTDLAEREQV